MAHDKQQAVWIGSNPERARIICLVAAERAEELLPALRDHFAREPQIAVVVERRTSARDLLPHERGGQIHRRAPVAERDPRRSLPPEFHHEAAHLRLVQRMEPLRRTYEDTDTADVVAKSLAMDPEAVSELWWRVAERVLARLTLRLGPLTADGAARDMLGRILDELPAYQAEREPLTAWLDAVVDRYAHECRAIQDPAAAPPAPSPAHNRSGTAMQRTP